MSRFKDQIALLEDTGLDVFWQGPASQASIDQLESLLSIKLPHSFRVFLECCGGGGVVGEEISGIEDNNPSLDYRGTLHGDTLRCREDYDLPMYLVVIYFNDDGAVWCLNTAKDGPEFPVIAYDIFSKSITPLASNFTDFFREYVTLRTSR